MTLIKIILMFFFLLTPFFVLSLFLEVCKNRTLEEKHKIAIKTSGYIFAVCLIILFFGQILFSVLGITLLAFQIGSGIILLLSGISMVNNTKQLKQLSANKNDPSLIPLTLPITVGPGTTGALMVLGANSDISIKLYNAFGLFFSVLLIFCLLYFSGFIEKIIKEEGLEILSKLTGLFLAALAVQSILNGIQNFLKLIQ